MSVFNFRFALIGDKELRFELNDNQALWFRVLDMRDNSYIDGVMIDYYPHDTSSKWYGRFDDFIDQDIIPKVSGVLKKVFGGGSATPPEDDPIAKLDHVLRNLKLVDNNTRVER